MENFKEDYDEIYILFKKTKKKLLMGSLISLLITFIAIAIVGLQLFYPFHFFIGITFYIISFIPIINRIRKSKKSFKKFHTYSFATSFYKKEKKRLFITILFLIGITIFFILRPMDINPFKDFSNQEITTLINSDLDQSIVLMDYLETSGNNLLATIAKEEENPNIAKEIENSFNEFLNAVVLSEELTEKHRYFDMIPYRLRMERAKSYIMTYSRYTKKYEIMQRLIVSTSGNEYVKKILNEHSELLERGNIYNEMANRFYSLKTRLRLSGGALYINTISIKRQTAYGESFTLLYNKAKGSYAHLFSHFDETLLLSGEIFVDETKTKMFDTWFPIQRNVANTMGHINISSRKDEKFIDDELIDEMQKAMEPGDVMLQRRNWYISNIGIPGFWTHSALYTGNLDEMDSFFSSEFPYKDTDSLSEYLQKYLPNIYTELQTTDSSVIEAIEPGVVLQSLRESAHADFVVVLRPNLNKMDKLQALITAFENRGKPYDYNFDFDTRDALVCSELIYDAYFENLPEKNGLHFETSLVNGRKIVSPLDMAKKFKNEHLQEDAEFTFVYFIRGDEETKSASVSTESVFLESVDWNKFSFMQ